MGRPSKRGSAVLIKNGDFVVQAARVGKGPLIQLWIHETGNGGRGMILDVEQTEILMDGLDLLLDEIEFDDEEVRTA